MPVAGPMPVSWQTVSRETLMVVIEGDMIWESGVEVSCPKAAEVCFSMSEATFLRTMAGRNGRKWPCVLDGVGRRSVI